MYWINWPFFVCSVEPLGKWKCSLIVRHLWFRIYFWNGSNWDQHQNKNKDSVVKPKRANYTRIHFIPDSLIRSLYEKLRNHDSRETKILAFPNFSWRKKYQKRNRCSAPLSCQFISPNFPACPLSNVLSLRLIQRVLQKFNNEKNIRLRLIPGRPLKIVTRKLVSKIKKPGSGETSSGFSKSEPFSRPKMQKKAIIISRKKRKAPLYNNNQQSRIKTFCRKLFDQHRDHFFLNGRWGLYFQRS